MDSTFNVSMMQTFMKNGEMLLVQVKGRSQSGSRGKRFVTVIQFEHILNEESSRKRES